MLFQSISFGSSSKKTTTHDMTNNHHSKQQQQHRQDVRLVRNPQRAHEKRRRRTHVDAVIRAPRLATYEQEEPIIIPSLSAGVPLFDDNIDHTHKHIFAEQDLGKEVHHTKTNCQDYNAILKEYTKLKKNIMQVNLPQLPISPEEQNNSTTSTTQCDQKCTRTPTTTNRTRSLLDEDNGKDDINNEGRKTNSNQEREEPRDDEETTATLVLSPSAVVPIIDNTDDTTTQDGRNMFPSLPLSSFLSEYWDTDTMFQCLQNYNTTTAEEENWDDGTITAATATTTIAIPKDAHHKQSHYEHGIEVQHKHKKQTHRFLCTTTNISDVILDTYTTCQNADGTNTSITNIEKGNYHGAPTTTRTTELLRKKKRLKEKKYRVLKSKLSSTTHRSRHIQTHKL